MAGFSFHSRSGARFLAIVLFLSAALWTCLLTSGQTAPQGKMYAHRQYRLFNGWGLSPVGQPIALPGDLPAKILPASDPRYLVVNSVGFNEHGVYVIDLSKRRVIQQVDLGKSWIGLAFSDNGHRVIASGGGPMPPEPHYWGVRLGFPPEARQRLRYPLYLLDWRHASLSFARGLELPKAERGARFVAGVASGPEGSTLLLDFQNDSVFRLRAGNLDVVATAKVGYRPYEVTVSPDLKFAAVSNWGDGSVSILNSRTLEPIARIPVGRLPNELVYSRDGRLFVANAGSNTVSVIRDNRVVETIQAGVLPDSPVGSTPDAIAVNPDGTRLFVADADNNCVAVVDISDANKSSVLGFIPTAWYPSAIAVSPNGQTLYIGVGKGTGIGPNVPYASPPPRLGRTPENLLDNPKRNATQYNYIGGLLHGFVYVLPVPDRSQLAYLTRLVLANTPRQDTHGTGRAANYIQNTVLSKIRHVLYIIRENRTYDEVFGDLPQGNGDPHLVLFGARVTPNAHQLAEQFVLLDNLYANGEVSQDGHSWCDSAYVTDFTEKAWMYKYSGRGELIQDGRLSASPGGTIWDLAGRHGLDFRNYGEGSARPGEIWKGLKGDFFGVRDTQRAHAFIQELQAAEKSGNWPQLMVMSLPTDHTEGLLPGAYSPAADVADNDLALGEIVEAISRSRFWKETAIFVVEDDAQDGPDHVDAHRTVGLVISPFVKRGVVDHTQYTQVSIERTIELILDLPAMSQFDAAATPFTNLFTEAPNYMTYVASVPQVNMLARNPLEGVGAAASLQLDFSALDRADPQKLNAILWHSVHPGDDLPAPVHGEFSRQLSAIGTSAHEPDE